MKTKLVLAVAALQLLVLAFMAGQREWILRSGTPLVLRTAPIDPSDPMRGAYVRLNYEISTVPASLCTGEVAKWTKEKESFRHPRRDSVVFASLKTNSHGIAELISLSDKPPASGPFLRGRTVSVSQNSVSVRYGIEAQFLSKEAAQRTERLGLERQGAPMNVTVAVGSSGISVLKDTAWEPLGITLAFDRQPPRAQNDPLRFQQTPLTGLTVTLHNYGDKPIAIVDLPGGRSFSLVPNLRWGDSHYGWSPRDDPAATVPATAQIIVLKPGTKHDVRLDFTDPRWFIADTRLPNATPIPFAKLPQEDLWSTSFRIEYSPPPAEVVRSLPNAELIRHETVRSRAFNANQGLD